MYGENPVEQLIRLEKERKELEAKQRREQLAKEHTKDVRNMAIGLGVVAAAELSNPAIRKTMFGRGFWIALALGVGLVLFCMFFGSY